MAKGFASKLAMDSFGLQEGRRAFRSSGSFDNAQGPVIVISILSCSFSLQLQHFWVSIPTPSPAAPFRDVDIYMQVS